MTKYNIGHYRTLQDGMFPHFLPSGKTGGETNQRDNLEWIETYAPKEMLIRSGHGLVVLMSKS